MHNLFMISGLFWHSDCLKSEASLHQARQGMVCWAAWQLGFGHSMHAECESDLVPSLGFLAGGSFFQPQFQLSYDLLGVFNVGQHRPSPFVRAQCTVM